MYDPCVENKMINDKHMTVVWHADDLMVSHADSFEFTKLSGYPSSTYGGLSVHRGEIHDYLGINLNYSKQVTVKVSMIKYLYSVLQ